MQPRPTHLASWLFAAALAGCALAPFTTTTPEEALARTPVSQNGAVVALADTARADAAAEKYSGAASALERALRIEPRNPRLWHELGRLKLKEGDYRQAASMAARSNTWVGANKTLHAANWRLIGEARRADGDEAGAQDAFSKAETLIR
jgi:cytochrome c-type biogenesis protein CcmH/NrfG